jgi:hypothetical protein
VIYFRIVCKKILHIHVYFNYQKNVRCVFYDFIVIETVRVDVPVWNIVCFNLDVYECDSMHLITTEVNLKF